MYKSINGQLPDSLTSMLKRTKNVYNQNRRNYGGYYIHHNKTFTIRYSGPAFWNALSQQLRELKTIKQVKRTPKELLLTGYEIICYEEYVLCSLTSHRILYIGIFHEFMPLVLENNNSTRKVFILINILKDLL